MAIADNESVVNNVIALLNNTIAMVPIIPAWPTTNPNRKNMMTPRIVNMQGVKTPAMVPNPCPLRCFDAALLRDAELIKVCHLGEELI
ncbi:hypothetical protein GCM10023156_22110 [Novipirellula rosea]|uniref:Uncharacterized protein n=1 Tax=Novipirellula rosea TaxID=1031540 RepID=A0ABP8MPZ2_9BACT